MGYSPPKCICNVPKVNTHSSKCIILRECLTDHLVPESSSTSSHLPKPRMRIIIFICGQPSDVYISIGSSPAIDIIYGLPSDVYQLSLLRRLIFLVWTTLRSFFSFRQPSETILSRLTSCTHSYHPMVPPVHMECMMPIPLQSISHVKYKHAYIHINFNHTIMLCNFTFHHIKINSQGLMIKQILLELPDQTH